MSWRGGAAKGGDVYAGRDANRMAGAFIANKVVSITTIGVVTESWEFVRSMPVGITAGVASRVLFFGVGTNRVYEIVPR